MSAINRTTTNKEKTEILTKKMQKQEPTSQQHSSRLTFHVSRLIFYMLPAPSADLCSFICRWAEDQCWL